VNRHITYTQYTHTHTQEKYDYSVNYDEQVKRLTSLLSVNSKTEHLIT